MDQLAAQQITVEVAYATLQHQRVLAVTAATGSRVRDVVKTSKIDQEFPEIDLTVCPLGIWGQAVDGDQLAKHGDRIEIYRPLINDPREARMRLARVGKTMGASADARGD